MTDQDGAGPLSDILAWAALVAAGVGAGLCGSVAGLASLVSYPALLAAGLPPLTANVTNTTAMTAVAVGSTYSAQRELAGLRRRLLVVSAIFAVGGTVGAILLLSTPASAFEAVVPWLIALGSTMLLLRDRLRRLLADRARRTPSTGPRRRWPTAALLTAVGGYAGYFGAGAGIIALALLSLRYADPLPVSNAVKNVATGAANLAATAVFLAVGPIDWAAALPLAVGMVVGGGLGPVVVRHLPERVLRVAIGLAGYGLAAYLAAS